MGPLLAQIPGTGMPGPLAGGLFVLEMKGLLLGLHPGPSLCSLDEMAQPFQAQVLELGTTGYDT